MTRIRSAFVLCLSAVLPFSYSAGQTTRDTLDDDFWNRFEEQVNRFVDSMTRDFAAAEDSVGSDTMQLQEQSPASGDAPRISYEGNTSIPQGDTVRGTVVIRGGDLIILGRVEGDVQADDASVVVRKGGVVTGNIRVTGGDIVRDEGSVIGGSLDMTWSRGQGALNEHSPFPRNAVIRPFPWMNENIDTRDLIFKYNRVQVVFLGLGSEKRYYWDGEKDFAPYGSIGYGFSEHRWRGNLGGARQIPLATASGRRMLEFGVEGYSLTDSKDQWRVGTGENTAVSFLIHEDFRDYFGREGFSIHSGYLLKKNTTFAEGSITFLADRYTSLGRKTDWALFGGDKTFRANPAINEGIMRSILAVLGVNTSTGTREGPDGWNGHLSAEFADNHALGGDFNFNRYVVDIRRYQPLGDHDNLNLRVRLGTTHGDLPRQKSFELGGFGTVPAYVFNSMPADTAGGNRMLLINAEYLVNGDFLGDLDFWPSWLMRHINFLFLTDAGLVRTVSGTTSFAGGFGGIHWSEFATDLGVGLTNRSGSFRIGMVWRTDKSEPVRLLLRVSRPF